MVNDGGPAFPVTSITGADMKIDYIESWSGMSLRDWFAGQAICGLMNEWPGKTLSQITAMAYVTADAMLKARE